MKIQQPASIDELYEKARYLLLYCYTSFNLVPYGNLRNPRRYYAVKNWGNFIIMDTTVNPTPIPYSRIEIPKYAATKYN